MSCPDLEQLEIFANGGLPAGQSKSLQAHVQDCPRCQVRVDEIRENRRLLDELDDAFDATTPRPSDGEIRGDDGLPTCGIPAADGREQPQEIGGYRILDVLGEGGMGIVYRAEQMHPHREVALKVMRRGLTSKRLLRRLEREAELLGRLQHAGIAQVFEASAVDTGDGVQPFFAMELVCGQPITQYARERALETHAVLQLLVSVCEAVEHAHQKGVIHRDLKPDNILVDGSGRPKVLDFGVARATDSDTQTTTLQTDVGQLIGTIPYMSPEQVSGDPAQMDTRSDVYSLGVVGFELLTGRLPHDLSGKTIPEAVRVIGEDDPARLSSVNRAFRGDLDAIFGTALERDKEQRYASASSFAADIRRYLHDEPVLARAPSATYQLRKLVVRYKTAFVLATLLFVSVLALAVVSTVQALRIADQRNEAQRQAGIAEAVVDFLNDDMLGSIDPQRAQGHEVTVAEALDAGAGRITGAFADAPLVEAAVRTTIGTAYTRLGKYPRAEPHLRAALTIRQSVLGTRHLDTAASQSNLAALLLAWGEPAAAVEFFQKSFETRRSLLGARHPDTLLAMGDLAIALRRNRQPAAAEELLDRLLALQREVLGEQDQQIANTLNSLGTLRYGAQAYEQAEAYYREALALREQAHGDNDLMVAQSRSNLAVALRQQGKYEEAQTLYRQALEVRSKILGDQHEVTANTRAGLAGLYIWAGDYATAEPLCAQVVAVLDEALEATNPRLGTARYAHGLCLIHLGRFEQAERLLLESYELLHQRLGDENNATQATLSGLVELYDTWGKPEQAAAWHAKLPPTSPHRKDRPAGSEP